MSTILKKICVFCGSSFGYDQRYREKARELGEALANNNITLVFGGGDVGLMGELSRSVIENNGRAVGVIPKKIYDMLGRTHVEETIIAKDMHERKAKMYELSDGFIALPGGIGTIEELFEAYTWYQLGYHLKPIGLLDVNNYFALLKGFLDHMVKEGFFKKSHRDVLLVENDAETLIDKMKNHNVAYHAKLK
jgi:uncharacterized protein (TIGR00730 family)